ncbi:MAG: tetratricopeptide repeat protein [Myxococcota bacterium]
MKNAAFEAVQEHLAAERQVLVWGAPGTGRTTLLGDIARATEFDVADTDSAQSAAAALAEGVRVVGCPSRAGLSADAYVECERLREDETLQELERRLVRDGSPVSTGLSRVARHCEGLWGAIARAATQLRVLTATELADRCDAALERLHQTGAGAHPLSDGRPRALSESLRRAACQLFLRGPLRVEEAEELLPDAVAVLVALRDHAALVRAEHVVVVPPLTAFSLALTWPFDEVAQELDDELCRRAHAALEGWRRTGREENLDLVARNEALFVRSAHRGMASEEADSDAVLDVVLAVQTLREVRVGAAASTDLLERAVAAFANKPAARRGQVELAHAHRLRGDFAGLAAILDAIDVQTLPDPVAERWHAERAQQLRQQRELPAATYHLEEAHRLAASLGWGQRQARHVVDRGTLHFWSEELDAAMAKFLEGRALAATLGARRTEAIALTNLCLCLALLGDERGAQDRGEEAARWFRTIDDKGALGATLAHLGILAFQHERLEEAQAYFEEAESLLAAARYVEQLRFVRFNRAECEFALGNLEEARTRALGLEGMLAEHPDTLVAMALDALQAEILESAERYPESLACLQRGLHRAREAESVEGLVGLGARRARVLARLGRRDDVLEQLRVIESLEAPRPDVGVAATLAMEHARVLIHEPANLSTLTLALRPSWEGMATRTGVGVSCADSISVRNAGRLCWEDLDRASRLAVERGARDPEGEAVCFDVVGRRAWLPGGRELAASARRNAFQLLWVLREGERSREELVAAMWPGEQMVKNAANNRLHNAVAQLRGLEIRVTREGEGYRLPNELRVVILGADPFVP